MAWHDEAFLRREAITVLNSAGTATPDVTISIPLDWDEFWDNIDASGNEIRVCHPNGYTVLDYEWTAFNSSTRQGTLVIDEYPAPGNAADEACLAWLYYKSSSTQGDASTTTTITSAETGVIDLSRPSYIGGAALRPQPGSTRPGIVMQKDPDEQLHVWLDITPALLDRRGVLGGRKMWEEPWSVEVTGTTAAGSPFTTLVDATRLRWVEDLTRGARRMFLKAFVKAGASGTNYQAEAEIRTRVPAESTAHKLFAVDVGVRVKTLLEA
jgi:hypothetical protein